MNLADLAHDPNTIVLGYNGSITQFTRSPLRPRARASAMRWIFSSLLRFNDDVELEGDLADRWETSADGKTLTFHLNRNAVWHDGHPVTVDDVIFSAGRLMAPNRYFRNTLHLHTGEPVEWRKVDDYTVTATTPRPYAALPSYLTATWASLFLVGPKHLLEHGDEDEFEKQPVGSGPYRFGEITDDGHAILLANDRYYGGKPLTERIMLRLFAKGEDRIAAYERGELDLVVAPGCAYTDEQARQHDGRLVAIRSNQIVQFGMNCRNPLFTTKVRQAITKAVDRETLVREIEGPDGLVAYGPVGPTSWAYEPNVEKHPYNPERARALLAEEGWTPGSDGVLQRNGERLSFGVRFVPDTWNVDYAAYGAGIKQYLSAVGIDLVVQPVEYWNGMKPHWRDQTFEAFMYYDTFYNEPDLYWSWHSSLPRRPEGPDEPSRLAQYGYGVTGYQNLELDKLVIAARETLDRSKRKALLSDAQKLLAEEAASLWLFNYPYRNIVHNRLQGTSKPSLAEGTADLIMTVYPGRLSKNASK